MSARYSVKLATTRPMTETCWLATSRAEADAIFEAQATDLRPGDELALEDHRTDTVLNTRSVPTAQERRAQADQAADWYLQRLDDDTQSLAKFAEKFAADPIYALSWADRAFEAAGKKSVLELIRALRTNNRAWPIIIDHLQTQALRMASQLNHSTSMCCNMVEDAKRAAMADAARELGWVAKVYAETAAAGA